jgi:hypothetical protein
MRPGRLRAPFVTPIKSNLEIDLDCVAISYVTEARLKFLRRILFGREFRKTCFFYRSLHENATYEFGRISGAFYSLRRRQHKDYNLGHVFNMCIQ